jgi:hypothetical protein
MVMLKFTLPMSLVSCALVMACATTPTPSDQAKPPSKIFDHSVVTPRNAGGSVLVTRDQGVAGSACPVLLTLEGRPIAELQAGEATTLYLAPGEYILARGAGTGLCYGHSTPALSFSLKSGERRAYRFSTDGAGNTLLIPSPL